MLSPGQLNILVEGNAAFGNIPPINKTAFRGSESDLVSAAQPQLKAYWKHCSQEKK
jgi:hypothetical protein